MKTFSVSLIAICLLSLAACDDLRNWNKAYLGGGEYLSNDKGMILNCKGELIGTSNEISEADLFWKDNNLPKGTTDFVCKDGKAYLPNKATDCQGNLIAKQSGGVEGFRAKHNLNNGNMRFTCNNGTVTPVPLSSLR